MPNRRIALRIQGIAQWRMPASEQADLIRFLEQLEIGRVNKGVRISESRRCKYLDVLRGAPRYKVVRTTVKHPDWAHAETVLPEAADSVQSITKSKHLMSPAPLRPSKPSTKPPRFLSAATVTPSLCHRAIVRPNFNLNFSLVRSPQSLQGPNPVAHAPPIVPTTDLWPAPSDYFSYSHLARRSRFVQPAR